MNARFTTKCCGDCDTDRKVLELSKIGRHWVAQLRIYPADGTFPAGYVISHDRVTGGKRGFARIRRYYARHDIPVVVLEN